MTHTNKSGKEQPADAELEAFLRGGRGGTALAALGTLVFVASIVFSFVRLRHVEEEMAHNRTMIEEQLATLERQNAEIRRNEERLATLAPAALRGFGWESSAEAGASIEPDAVQASLAAHDEVTKLTMSQPRVADGQRVVYYAKSPEVDVNQENFIASLRELGFTVQVVRPVNPVRSSNALWFGRNVEPAAVELAGQALIRAGYELQHVGEFQNATDRKADLIEIGARPQSIADPRITSASLASALRNVQR